MVTGWSLLCPWGGTIKQFGRQEAPQLLETKLSTITSEGPRIPIVQGVWGSDHNHSLHVERSHLSLHKSLDFFIHFTTKFPLVIMLFLIGFVVFPASATILVLYLLITVLFALPSFLVLYFAYPSLGWLIREITSWDPHSCTWLCWAWTWGKLYLRRVCSLNENAWTNLTFPFLWWRCIWGTYFTQYIWTYFLRNWYLIRYLALNSVLRCQETLANLLWLFWWKLIVFKFKHVCAIRGPLCFFYNNIHSATHLCLAKMVGY